MVMLLSCPVAKYEEAVVAGDFGSLRMTPQE
jgi:hypothetical protein